MGKKIIPVSASKDGSRKAHIRKIDTTHQDNVSQLTIRNPKENSNVTVGEAAFLSDTVLTDERGVRYLPANQLESSFTNSKTEQIDWDFHFKHMFGGSNTVEIEEELWLEKHDEERMRAKDRAFGTQEPVNVFMKENDYQDEYIEWKEENDYEPEDNLLEDFINEKYGLEFEEWENETIENEMEPIDHEATVYGFVSSSVSDETGEVFTAYNSEFAYDSEENEMHIGAPMMNFVYPCEINMDVEKAAFKLADTNLVAVTDVDNGRMLGLSLSGGGMDFSWDIAEAYVRLGHLPPADICRSLPRFAGAKLTPINKRVIEASKLSCLNEAENEQQKESIEHYFNNLETHLRENGIREDLILGVH